MKSRYVVEAILILRKLMKINMQRKMDRYMVFNDLEENMIRVPRVSPFVGVEKEKIHIKYMC